MESISTKTYSNVLKRTALFVALFTSFLTAFMGSSVSIALPTIGTEFSMTAILLSWVSTIYLLAAAMFLIPFGRLSDMFGRKKILSYGISLYTLASLLSAISRSALPLFSARSVSGRHYPILPVRGAKGWDFKN